MAHAAEPVNSVLGDTSWVAAYGRMPTEKDGNEERIQTHIRFVIERLQRAPVPADPERAVARAQLIAELGRYVERGVFPLNTEHVGRVPRFIDDTGRACAVGHLLRTSGQGELAEALRRAHEYDTIAVIATGPLGNAVTEWAVAHGLTVDELAEIQPQYGFEEVEKIQITRPQLEQILKQEEYRFKHCLRSTLGTVVTSLKVTLTVWPGKSGTIERAIDLSLTPASPAAEDCIRKRLDTAYFHDIALYQNVKSKLDVTRSYEHLNQLTPAAQDRVADARKKAQAALTANGQQLVQCLQRNKNPATVATKLLFLVGSNGEIGLAEMAAGGYQTNRDCAASVLGWPALLTAAPSTEPFELSLQLKLPPIAEAHRPAPSDDSLAH